MPALFEQITARVCGFGRAIERMSKRSLADFSGKVRCLACPIRKAGAEAVDG
jgi:hypothetical protein